VLLDDLGYENYYSKQVIPSRLIAPFWFLPQNHGEGGSEQVRFRPLENPPGWGFFAVSKPTPEVELAATHGEKRMSAFPYHRSNACRVKLFTFRWI